MVLAAGLGTRLLPLSAELPKPLMPVGDRPVLAHLASRLAREGFPSFAMNIHYLLDEFTSYYDDLDSSPKVIEEPEIRGTAGGVAGARGLFGEPPILIWNGDVLVDPPVEALLTAAQRAGLAFAVAPRPPGTGTVGLGATGGVVRLRGERFGDEVSGGDYVGVAAIGARVLESLPERGCLVGDVALPLLRAGESVATARVAGDWIDIGSLAAYRRANGEWLERTAGAAASWVSPSATVGAGVRLTASIVGHGASIGGSGDVVRSIVWPGAQATAPLYDAIVTTSGRVVSVS
jgi:mannose-1-phosphate guanylyltransferase